MRVRLPNGYSIARISRQETFVCSATAGSLDLPEVGSRRIAAYLVEEVIPESHQKPGIDPRHGNACAGMFDQVRDRAQVDEPCVLLVASLSKSLAVANKVRVFSGRARKSVFVARRVQEPARADGFGKIEGLPVFL